MTAVYSCTSPATTKPCLMRGIRATHVSADEGLDGDDKGWLLTVTGLVERIFWLFGALAR